MNNEANKLKQMLIKLDNKMPEILGIMGKEAQAFFKDTFNKKGFTNENFEAWEADEDSKGGELLVKMGRWWFVGSIGFK